MRPAAFMRLFRVQTQMLDMAAVIPLDAEVCIKCVLKPMQNMAFCIGIGCLLYAVSMLFAV